VRCLPVTMVRNHLIEHPPAGLYSFAGLMSGPRVRPSYREQEVYSDPGPNTNDLVDAIVTACQYGPKK
jgi:hypothetical protein